MNYKLEQNEQYAVIELIDTALTVDNAPEFENVVRNLFRKGYNNMIVQASGVDELDGHGVSAIRKAQKICQNEAGLFVFVSKNAEIIERLDLAKIQDLTILPTQQEAIDAVFLNELENEYEEEGTDDDFDFDGFSEGTGDSKIDDY